MPAPQEELSRQQARYAQINSLYGELKVQLERLTEALSLKDAELEQKKQESSQSREELVSLRSKVLLLQNELTDAEGASEEDA